jgi:hypothetical protein
MWLVLVLYLRLSLFHNDVYVVQLVRSWAVCCCFDTDLVVYVGCCQIMSDALPYCSTVDRHATTSSTAFAEQSVYYEDRGSRQDTSAENSTTVTASSLHARNDMDTYCKMAHQQLHHSQQQQHSQSGSHYFINDLLSSTSAVFPGHSVHAGSNNSSTSCSTQLLAQTQLSGKPSFKRFVLFSDNAISTRYVLLRI